MKQVALYGGSFDPPHIGHQAIIEALKKLNFLDEIIVMPTFLNPFKDNSFTSAPLRLRWLREMFLEDIKVQVSAYESDAGRKVPAIESVKHLLETYDKVYLVVGADNLATLHKWYKYDEFKDLVTFIIASRDGIEVPDKFLTLEINEEISSSSLRKKIKQDKLPKKVSQDILKEYNER